MTTEERILELEEQGALFAIVSGGFNYFATKQTDYWYYYSFLPAADFSKRLETETHAMHEQQYTECLEQISANEDEEEFDFEEAADGYTWSDVQLVGAQEMLELMEENYGVSEPRRLG